MIFVIVPAVVSALGVGVAAWAARRSSEEAARNAEEADRQARKVQQEARERDDHHWRTIVAGNFITQHELHIEPERLIELAKGGATSLRRYITTTESRLTDELRQESARIQTLEGEMKESARLMEIIGSGENHR